MSKVAALYDSRAEAEYARERLVSECGASTTRVLAKETAAAIDGLGFSRTDMETYREGVMRGGHLVVTEVAPGTSPKKVVQLLQSAIGKTGGAPDVQVPDAEEGIKVQIPANQEPEKTPKAVADPPTPEPTAEAPVESVTAPTEANSDDEALRFVDESVQEQEPQPEAEQTMLVAEPLPAAAPVAAAPSVPEEQRATQGRDELRAGQPEVVRGGARVRSFTRETPAEEQVMLRGDLVEVESRSSEKQLSQTEVEAAGLFKERVIEIVERREEPVVTKVAVVREEIIVRKTVEERTETIRDTVRHTEVEVQDLASSGR